MAVGLIIDGKHYDPHRAKCMVRYEPWVKDRFELYIYQNDNNDYFGYIHDMCEWEYEYIFGLSDMLAKELTAVDEEGQYICNRQDLFCKMVDSYLNNKKISTHSL